MKYSSNVAISANGTAFAKSSYNSPSYAFQGGGLDTSHPYMWYISNAFPNYLGFNLNIPRIIDKVQFYLKTDQMPINMCIQASTDGSSYNTLYASSNWKADCGVSSQYGYCSIILNNKISYKYYIIYYTSSNSDYVYISDFEMFMPMTNKYLIKQANDNSNLYTIDKTSTTGTKAAAVLTSQPDFTQGFELLPDIVNNITVNGDTFRPVTKLSSPFNIYMCKP